MALTEEVIREFTAAKYAYDAGANPLEKIGLIGLKCYEELENNAEEIEQGSYNSTMYHVFEANSAFSRPIRPDLFVTSKTYAEEWEMLVERISSSDYLDSAGFQLYFDQTEQTRFDKLIYTNISCFSCVYDLWKPGSRKTPGTYFEVLVGSLLSAFYPNCTRTKFISIPNETEKVTTDIVLYSEITQKGLVIPVKITTRERVVQPFAHQRILNSVFGENQYQSLLVSVSEMQRDKEDGVNQICVPGTIRLFHKYLAPLKGIIYLDPPERYLQQDVSALVPVKTFCSLFTPFVGEVLR